MIVKNMHSWAGKVAIAAISITMLTASHHFLSGLAVDYPEYDINDAYVFAADRPEYTTFILSVNPSTPGASDMNTKTTFGSGGLYNFHIASDDKVEEGLTFTLSFNRNKVSIGLIDDPNAPIGYKGSTIGRAKIGQTFELSNGVKGWTGRASDPFFGDGAGLGAYNAKKSSGKYDPSAFDPTGDLFASATTSVIVLEVPNTMLGEHVYYYTTTALKRNGEWVQINRYANILMPYVFFSDTPAVQEDHDQHRPDSDIKERRQALVNNVFYSVSITKSQEDPFEYANKVADLILPDLLRYKVGTKAEYVIGNMNGRALQDDAMNTSLHLMAGTLLDDGVNSSGKYKSLFPYVIPFNK